MYKDEDKISTFYSNGAGLEWSCTKKGIILSIQIQNGQYRHAIKKYDYYSSKIGKKFEKHNKNGREWIEESDVKNFLKVSNDDEAFEIGNNVLDNAIYPQKEERLFNVFETVGGNGYKFLYQYKRIKQDATIIDVLNYLNRDIKLMKM